MNRHLHQPKQAMIEITFTCLVCGKRQTYLGTSPLAEKVCQSHCSQHRSNCQHIYERQHRSKWR